MRDPFPLEPIPWLVRWSQPWSEWLNLRSLPLHIHEVAASALLYSLIFWPLSPIVSRWLAPRHYPKLPRSKRLNWDAHVVSMFQSLLINSLAIWVLVSDEELHGMSWEERVWGYTGASAMIQALASGYFLWDLVITSRNLDVFGLGTLAHALAALAVYLLGFRPFVNYYSCCFILWELSTPFLNIHWFLDKIGMTGTRLQFYNGLLLLFTFFSCRLVYGTYQSYLTYLDVRAALNVNPSARVNDSPSMVFVSDASTVPLWLGLIYLACNIILNGLNSYWFVVMIRAVRKRFEPGAPIKKEDNVDLTEANVDLASMASALDGGTKLSRRR